MAHAIIARELVKTYRRPQQDPVNAVDGIDLEIDFGECYCLLGPNGAGKSTTVEMLDGARTPTSGELSVLGFVPARAPAAFRARIGVVVQEATDGSHFTVAQTMRHLARIYPNPADCDELIAAVGLSEKANDKVSSLSGGQRRRLDVALGLVGRPEILFLDEPTTGFDPVSRRQFWDLIRRLHGDGTTIVLTTHYLDEAEALADRIGIINHGVLIDEGPPDAIGGPFARVPRVRWVDEVGTDRVERTETPTALISSLAPPDGGEITGLRVVRPSLEDVYVELIGSADDAGTVSDAAAGAPTEQSPATADSPSAEVRSR
ncbi:Daunorubicin/doxorubicin resistance ATP-binding protein DrrA [Brevibacterium casei]|uniref:ABC transporter n=1 Tax=Brevibacterium casei TaxID=33889 RepID=A0A269ZIE2_9MICO|nr:MULTISPECIES: ABC transporter ATP-binding protein [Brevibacterium]MCM1013156.1 ABC transporter ATP-binding protein [Brevibacterium sp. XM4083]PAK97351.1 ABC transporter [Brevibacterium casei]QPS34579.1 ABC transporter ATP-binding protein [Brevibacterium casei]VEW10904.1 Daunorubicin/doxorubicin resistance ATP-binding protein DrrA [Brevibacterium casei]